MLSKLGFDLSVHIHWKTNIKVEFEIGYSQCCLPMIQEFTSWIQPTLVKPCVWLVISKPSGNCIALCPWLQGSECPRFIIGVFSFGKFAQRRYQVFFCVFHQTQFSSETLFFYQNCKYCFLQRINSTFLFQRFFRGSQNHKR